ncbi:MAG: phosphopantothenoylcysteine decarboxylase [Endomicrobium sp.]|jgi:phosphopantothenoylcysteine synthetase/decarboxylase|nr:phosphopantothenoylcysteine decarboxylase [Endomicrobium sp.]
MKKLTFLITSGPTREYIDPVRFISNDSSGKMGRALALSALKRGHKVIFISGPSGVYPSSKAEIIKVVSAADMFKAVKKNLFKADVVIGAAAVSDFKPVFFHRHKIKKTGDNQTGGVLIKLKKNPDIIAYCAKNKRSRIVAGFALETKDLIKNARGKMKDKNLDLVVANAKESISCDLASVFIINKNGGMLKLENAGKKFIAGKIIDEIIGIYKNNQIGKKCS